MVISSVLLKTKGDNGTLLGSRNDFKLLKSKNLPKPRKNLLKTTQNCNSSSLCASIPWVN